MLNAKITAVFALAASSSLALAQQPAAATKQAGAPTQRVAGAVVPAWPSMEQALRKRWTETYPRETLVSVEKVGDPKFIDEPGKTDMSSSTRYSDVWDWSWNSTTTTTITKGREGAFLRQDVVALVERPNKTRAKFTVVALYKLVGGQWSFVEVPVGKVEEMAGAGAPAQLSDDDVAKIFSDAWASARPDFTVQTVRVKTKELHQSGGRYWVTYRLTMEVTGTDKAVAALKGKRAVCEPSDYSSVLRWDKDASRWTADDKMIANINETADCKEP